MIRPRARLLPCLSLVALSLPAAAQLPTAPTLADVGEDDVVVLESGERLLGEIRELSRGKLRFKTDALETVYITWAQVAAVASRHEFQIEDLKGDIRFGSLEPTGRAGTVSILSESWIEELELAEIVSISLIKSTFWSRLDGAVSAGLNVVTASNTNQFTLHADATHVKRRYRNEVTFDNVVNDANQENRTSRQDLVYKVSRDYSNRWLGIASSTLQSNEELSLDFRALASATAAHRVLQTPKRKLGLGAGIAAVRERFFGAETETGIEGVLLLEYEAFSFTQRDVDIRNSLLVYPSLTTSGRVRVEISARISRELIKDLFWSMNLNFSFDSDPTAPGGIDSGQQSDGGTGGVGEQPPDPKGDDLSLSMSLGWKF